MSTIDDNGVHRLEAELQEQFRHDPAILDFLQRSCLDGIWYWDLERPAEEWMSPEFWNLFGVDHTTKAHDPEEWQDLIHPDDRDLALANFEQHCADPEHAYDQIVRYAHADGSTVWVRCRGLAVRDEEGTPVRMLGAHTDITQLKIAEEQLRQQVRQVENTNAELSAFAYAMSHDLRAPLNTLDMILRELEAELGEGASDFARSLFERGRATIARSGDLIDDVLHYSRVVDQPLDCEDIDLGVLVKEATQDLQGLVADGDVDVEIGNLPTISANRFQMKVLVQNLLSNALKFRASGCRHRVAVSGGVDAGQTWLRVSDNGIGIAEAQQEKVFGMFERLNHQTDFPGTGLGLALCRRIAMNHGGSISLRSAPGEGTEFTVQIPVRSS